MNERAAQFASRTGRDRGDAPHADHQVVGAIAVFVGFDDELTIVIDVDDLARKLERLQIAADPLQVLIELGAAHGIEARVEELIDALLIGEKGEKRISVCRIDERHQILDKRDLDLRFRKEQPFVPDEAAALIEHAQLEILEWAEQARKAQVGGTNADPDAVKDARGGCGHWATVRRWEP